MTDIPEENNEAYEWSEDGVWLGPTRVLHPNWKGGDLVAATTPETLVFLDEFINYSKDAKEVDESREAYFASRLREYRWHGKIVSLDENKRLKSL